MKYEEWNIPSVDEAAVETLMEDGYSYLLSAVLSARGVKTWDAAREYLRCDDHLTVDPLLMKDMDRAVARIRRALDEHERIAVYGDYDVDGITATCLVADALRREGGDCITYIPHRIDEGYGLNTAALEKIKAQGASLVITVDCGITGVEEASFAREIGLDLVITDHHECKDVLPDAVAVVDPHRSDCNYPFPDLAGVGVALKLTMALAGAGRSDEMFLRGCCLAAIGTVADVMPMTGENRIIVQCGLERLGSCDCVGLQALLEEVGLSEKKVTSTNIGFILAPRINAAGRMGVAHIATELFLTHDADVARRLASDLCTLNKERQSVEQTIFSEAEEQILTLPEDARSALVLSSDTWHQGVIGIVASRLSEKYACPSFMIYLSGAVGKGSCRSWGGFNLFNALEQCADLLIGFGGHALAAGFTIARDAIPAFTERINACVRAYFGQCSPAARLHIDAPILQPHLLDAAQVQTLSALEPYGAGNTRPVFCIEGLTADRLQNVGQNRHLKAHFIRGTVQLDAIFFSVTAEECGVRCGDRVDAAFYLNVNEFRGMRLLQLQLLDLRPSQKASGREARALEKVESLLSGAELTRQDAQQLRPTRTQFESAWRYLLQIVPAQGAWRGAYLPMLRAMGNAVCGESAFARSVVCLCVFCERALLHGAREGEMGVFSRRPVEGKVDLDASPLLRALDRALEDTGR